MRVLMVQLATAERDETFPFGLLYAASAAVRAGHEVKVVDMVTDRLEAPQVLQAAKEYSPHVIGLSGITSCYKCAKQVLQTLRAELPDVPRVVGGVISSIPELLLERAGADIVVHGEGEIVFPRLLEALQRKEPLSEVRGLSYLDDGRVRKTEPQPQLKDLDEIPTPEFGLLDMRKYMIPAERWARTFYGHDASEYAGVQARLDGKRNLFAIITARGCTHRCLFCYRHYRGWRQHSVDYVLRLMRHLHERYGVDIFQFNDELSTTNREWVLEFCDKLRASKLDVVFIVLSSRVDHAEEDMLCRLSAAGCLIVNYGYESGSDIILKEIRKGVTREQGLRAGLLTQKAGIKNVPEIMIGFPSETEKTIGETIDFLKRLNTWPISVNTPIPFPETALWKIALEKGLIRDVESFILGYKNGYFVNFTRFSDRELQRQVKRVHAAVRLHWLLRRRKYVSYALSALRYALDIIAKSLLPLWLDQVLRVRIRRWRAS